MTRLGLLMACLLSAAPALADTGWWLKLSTAEPKARAASLLAPAPEAPALFHEALLGDIEMALADNISSFEHDLLFASTGDGRLAGAGDDSGGLALLAGILGFIPGFGLGHLITGNIGGFLLFLIIDIVIGVVFFGVLGAWNPFAYWYLPGFIVIFIERIVEAFMAANSATEHHGYADSIPREEIPTALPQGKAAFTLMHF